MQAPTDWHTSSPRLTVDDLNALIKRRPPGTLDTIGKRRLVISLLVFEKFLGWNWCVRHLFEATTGFLWLDFSNLENRERTTVRLFELADNIFNLQCVEGVNSCLDRLKTANVASDQIESTYAELEFARILSLYDIAFRFIPEGEGKSADFEIEYPDGLRIHADSKCKLQGSQFSEVTIKTTIKDARRQFNKEIGGIVFIKIPQPWAEDNATRVQMRDAAIKYMAGTGRIASAKYYAEMLTFEPEIIRRRYAFLEISNPRCRIDARRDWTLFRENSAKYPGTPGSKWFEIDTLAK